VVAQAERLALDHESQAGVDGAHARALVLAEETRVLGGIRGGVEAPAERCDVLERGLETLAGAAERRRLFLGDLGVDPPVRVPEPAHLRRAIASA